MPIHAEFVTIGAQNGSCLLGCASRASRHGQRIDSICSSTVGQRKSGLLMRSETMPCTAAQIIVVVVNRSGRRPRELGDHRRNEVVEALERLRAGQRFTPNRRCDRDLAGLEGGAELGVIDGVTERRPHEHQPVVLGMGEAELDVAPPGPGEGVDGGRRRFDRRPR